MNFPKSHKELLKIFMDAGTPVIDDLNGEYVVDMLTVWPSFKNLYHLKVIDNIKRTGYNQILDIKWGSFFVQETVSVSTGSIHVAEINYNVEANTFLTRGIRDHLRCIKRGDIYIGRFNYEFAGRLIFLGYFSLHKALRVQDIAVAQSTLPS